MDSCGQIIASQRHFPVFFFFFFLQKRAIEDLKTSGSELFSIPVVVETLADGVKKCNAFKDS